MVLEVLVARPKLLRGLEGGPSKAHEQVVNHSMGQVLDELGAERDGGTRIDGNPTAIKGSVVEGAEGQAVAWIDPQVGAPCPGDDVAGNEQRRARQVTDATPVVVGGQD